jgi:hypothetical protein
MKVIPSDTETIIEGSRAETRAFNDLLQAAHRLGLAKHIFVGYDEKGLRVITLQPDHREPEGQTRVIVLNKNVTLRNV